uniref:Secreted protein n=1 Tax=Romanomermis culicivorax TaxID=13658 RepID=A0A915L1H4_ROMCU
MRSSTLTMIGLKLSLIRKTRVHLAILVVLTRWTRVHLATARTLYPNVGTSTPNLVNPTEPIPFIVQQFLT